MEEKYRCENCNSEVEIDIDTSVFVTDEVVETEGSYCCESCNHHGIVELSVRVKKLVKR